MKLFPADALNKIELNKVRALAQNYALSALAKQKIDKEGLETNFEEVLKSLGRTREVKKIFDDGLNFPLSNYRDIREILEILDTDNAVLLPEQVIEIYRNNAAVHIFLGFFEDKQPDAFSHLKALSSGMTKMTEINQSIEKVMDETGAILDSASTKLSAIRSEMRAKESELDRFFSKVLKKYKRMGMLADNAESIKYGRRVLSLPAENKRKIDGIIHAESSSGKTIFMEPAEVTLLNNQLSELRIDEKNEIYRILRELTAEIAPYQQEIFTNLGILVRLDVIQAKARLARQMDAILPEIEDQAAFNVIHARHPLLLIKNNELGIETVPFDLYLNNMNRFILLSGPNAGGKTVCLKTIGLMQSMLQSGYLVPVQDGSSFGIFHSVFIELGDQQSIENELSTYSSRLHSMKYMLEKAHSRSLILIDEFGSGTDPKIGGAIAEAILEEMLTKKCIGLITTHYDNLKKFAFKKKGIVNASMLFDMKNINPTYHLRIGKPGSSYALEIAHRIGIRQNIINRAKKIAGKKHIEVEDLLNTIEQERIKSQQLKEELDKKTTKLDRLINQYEQLFKEFEVKRKKLRMESKQIEAQKAAAKKIAVEKYLKELRSEEKSNAEVEKLAIKMRKTADEKSKELSEITEQYKEKAHAKSNAKKTFKQGDHVKLKTGSSAGEIVSMKNDYTATVQMGLIKVDVPLHDLVHVREPLEVRKKKSVQLQTDGPGGHFSTKLDIRGFKMKEAEDLLDKFFDKAVLTGSNQLKILHGKGSGVLKRVVWQKAKDYNAENIKHESKELGGEGVSIVKL